MTNLTQFGKWLETAKSSTGHKFSRVTKEKYRRMESWIEPFNAITPVNKILEIYGKAVERHNYPLIKSFFTCDLRFVFINNKKKLKQVIRKMTEEFDSPPVSKRDVGKKTLTVDEIKKIKEFINGIDNYVGSNTKREMNKINMLKERKDTVGLLINIAYDTGARIKEFQNILFKNVNLNEGYIELLRKRGKTRKKEISIETRELLQDYLQNKHFNPSDKIFSLSYSQLYGALKTLGNISISKPISSHWLRFSILQHLADNGASERQLMSFGDLDSPDTVSVYVRNSKIQEQGALEKHPSFMIK